MTKRKCKILAVVAWVAGTVFGSLPFSSAAKDPDLWVCGVANNKVTGVEIQRLVIAGVILITMLLLCLVYVRIFMIAFKHTKHRRKLQNLDPSNRKAMVRTAVTTAIILGAFAICWLPSTVKFIIEIYINTTEDKLFIIQTTADILAYGNSMVDPIIYGYRNDLFRSTYKRIFRRVCGSFKRNETSLPITPSTQDYSTSHGNCTQHVNFVMATMELVEES